MTLDENGSVLEQEEEYNRQWQLSDFYDYVQEKDGNIRIIPLAHA